MENNFNERTAEEIKLENEACEKFEKMIESFSISTQTNEETIEKYPENYGGAYYSDGKLNILLVEIPKEAELPYSKIIGSDNINYEKSEFSLNYLLNLYKYLVDVMSDNKNGDNINTVGVSQKDNKIIITVSTPESAEDLTKDLLSKEFNKNAFEIIVDDSRPTPVATYARPGDRVYRWSNGTRDTDIATIGFNAKNSSGVSGYVTAEHALWISTSLGIYEYDCSAVSKCTGSKTTDSCFVPFNSAISGVTGLIDNSGLYGNTKYQLTSCYGEKDDLEGVTLTMFGKASKKYTGVVNKTKISYKLKNESTGVETTIPDALELKTPYGKPAGGDSGGPVTRITNASVSPQTAILAGIMSASTDYISASGNYALAYVPKIHNITAALNVTFSGGSN